jgi:probable HAF family extracellular repeat protein
VPDGVQSFARDLSASGSVVIGTYSVADPTGVRQLAFRWEAGTFEAEALGVSDDGPKVVGRSRGVGRFQRPSLWTGSVVIGTYQVEDRPGVSQPVFRWEPGAFQDLGALDPNTGDAEALAVSDDGSKVVGWSRATSGFQRPFLWTAAGGMQELSEVPCCEAKATGISPDGAVIVGYYLPATGEYHGFRWSAGVMTDLGLLPDGSDTKSLALCGPGAAAVDMTSFQGKAFRWRASGGMEDLGFGHAGGCPDDSSVVAGTELAKDTLAAPSDPKGLRTLDALGGLWVGIAVGGAPLRGTETLRPGRLRVTGER